MVSEVSGSKDTQACKICGSAAQHIFSLTVLNKYTVKYYHCGTCHFIFTEEPYWLEEAYSEAISVLDTGVVYRNLDMAEKMSSIIMSLFDVNAKFLDYAGGYGIFARTMRDRGFDFYWKDKYSENLVCRGFEYDTHPGQVGMVTLFEAFEHFTDPLDEIENLLNYSKTIAFSTDLIPPEHIPDPGKWIYYSPETGQHISFYSKKTLEYIAAKYGLTYYNLLGIHFLTDRNLKSFQRTLNFFSSFKGGIRLFKYYQKYRMGSALTCRVENDRNYLTSLLKQRR